MSSRSYSAHLSVDDRSRAIVKVGAVVLFVLASLLILGMPFAIPVRIAVFLVWAVMSLTEMRRFWRAYRSYGDIRVLAGGEMMLQNAHREWMSGELGSGSVLWRHVGWLCIDTQDGCRFAELILAHGQSTREWRRLQVIWRHIGAAD